LITATSLGFVDTDDLRGILATVGGLHRDLVGIRDDVRVGQDVTVGADDEARALAHRRRRVALLLPEATEEFEERIVGRHAVRSVGDRLPLADDRDVARRPDRSARRGWRKSGNAAAKRPGRGRNLCALCDLAAAAAGVSAPVPAAILPEQAAEAIAAAITAARSEFGTMETLPRKAGGDGE
jgi:hypothetical protein